jgi:hypothetical protein
MRAKGWEVNCRPEYHSGREVYAWRHEVSGGDSPTLRISQGVLEGYPARAILELLDRLKVAAALQACPECVLVVVQNGLRVTLEEMPWADFQDLPGLPR